MRPHATIHLQVYYYRSRYIALIGITLRSCICESSCYNTSAGILLYMYACSREHISADASYWEEGAAAATGAEGEVGRKSASVREKEGVLGGGAGKLETLGEDWNEEEEWDGEEDGEEESLREAGVASVAGVPKSLLGSLLGGSKLETLGQDWNEEEDWEGTQFTCFTSTKSTHASTKVHMLTPEEDWQDDEEEFGGEDARCASHQLYFYKKVHILTLC